MYKILLSIFIGMDFLEQYYIGSAKLIPQFPKMFVPIWTPTISVWDSGWSTAMPTLDILVISVSVIDGIWWHISSGYILIALITKDVEYFSTCLIHWITSLSKLLSEDSVHCLFYFVVIRTCLCSSKFYLCVCICVYTDENQS